MQFSAAASVLFVPYLRRLESVMLNESNSVTSSVTERFGIRNAKKINPFEATFCSCIVVLSMHDYRRIFLKKIRTF